MTIALPVLASNWEQISDGIFVDRNSIKSCSYKYSSYEKFSCLWVKDVQPDKKALHEILNKKLNEPSYVLNYHIINHSKKQFAIKSMVFYDENGNVIYTITNEDCMLGWHDIIPDTYSEIFYNIVKCPSKNINKPNIIQKNKNHYTISP